MSEYENFDTEAIRSLLREIADLCEHASLTGALNGGAARVATRYNAVLARLEEANSVPRGMFAPVDSNASFGEIGVEARMLASFIKRDRKGEKIKGGSEDASVLIRLAPFVKREDLSRMVQQQMEQGSALDMDLITKLAPFLDQSMLSEILRDHISPPKPPRPQPAPEPASEPAPAPTPPEPAYFEAEIIPPRYPVPAREAKISVLIERLKDPTLSHIEQAEILDRLRSLPSE